MSTVADSDLVNELARQLGTDIGELDKLGTEDKDNLVDSINEIVSRLEYIEAQLGIR